MPFGEIRLIPGVNVERTPTLNEAGVSQSQLIRYRDGLVEKYGGWAKFFPFSTISDGIIRDLHAWQDLEGVKRLLYGSTMGLACIESPSGTFTEIIPQQKTTNPAPDFTTVAGIPTVLVIDPGIANVTTLDTVMFETPIFVGGLVLSGLYRIDTIISSTGYLITASQNAEGSTTDGGNVPLFTTTSGSVFVLVNTGSLTGSNYLTAGDSIVFQVSTTGNGVTISGGYKVVFVIDNANFLISASTAANANGSFSMNGGLARIVYNISLTDGNTSQTGTAITALDWTSDNWGEIVLACPKGGGVYQYKFGAGFTNAQIIPTAPILNNGIFISTTLQILFCWGSSIMPNSVLIQNPPASNSGNSIGVEVDPLLINWSDLEDFTNFTPSTTNQAGNFRIPIGSEIRAGLAIAQQNMFWTDTDTWVANYAGFPLVFGFNRIGVGAGAISSHAVQRLRGGVYWMGPSNFYSFGSDGVNVIPCPVWDVVFQNINTDFTSNVRAMPNTGFNEVGWLYPSSSSVSGECDSYVKFNITEQGKPWDYGLIDRTAWIDQSVIGQPISATSTGFIYSQETTRNADGLPLVSSFTTGYFYIGLGEEFAFVDQIIPDMKWDFFGGASSATVSLTFHVIDYPGDTPVSYGPYTMTSTTEYITVRFRGRQVSVTVASSDLGSFWRLGKIRYRYAAAGRR